MPLSIDESGAFDNFSLRKELTPYLPYIDKAPQINLDKGKEPEAATIKRSPWIDFRLIQDWITACNDHHGDHCSPDRLSEDSSPSGPLWFIDAVERRLVPAKPNMKYFALSYVWGKSSDPGSELYLQKSNLEWMQQEWSLHNPRNGERRIPQLIDDVIEITTRLSWRYIWIDRYCIVQDDGPVKESQINAMNSIYAGAYATLVAAGSDVDRGIQGIKGHNDRRGVGITMEHVSGKPVQESPVNESISCWTQNPEETEENSLQEFRDRIHANGNMLTGSDVGTQTLSRVSSFDSFDSFQWARRQVVKEKKPQDRKMLEAQAYLLMHSPWYSRGWTFQEALFSRRKIVFQNGSVNWECHCTAWYEGQESFGYQRWGPCNRFSGFNSESGFDSPCWPDLYRYSRLVCLFNRRLLTFPEDALFAFAGVTSSLSHTFMDGFVSGLPQMFFHSTLIWQPFRPVTRRKSKSSVDAILPSWSWAGWEGVIQYESWRSGYSYTKTLATEQGLDETTWKTYETVKWYRRDSQDSKHGIKAIDSEKFAVTSQKAGWRSTFDPGSRKTVYYHKDLPDTEFWKPVMLRDPMKAPVPPRYCRHLTVRTNQVFLDAGEVFEANKASRCTCIDLINDDKEWVGVLRLMTVEPPNKKYELIELSAGSVEKRPEESTCFDEWDRAGFQRCWSNKKYEFYNVMAIAWIEGVAYREAIGRVEKLSWEKLEQIPIEVRLG